MIKKNPDDSVRKEQIGTDEDASVTKKDTQATNAQTPDSQDDSQQPEKEADRVKEKKEDEKGAKDSDNEKKGEKAQADIPKEEKEEDQELIDEEQPKKDVEEKEKKKAKEEEEIDEVKDKEEKEKEEPDKEEVKQAGTTEQPEKVEKTGKPATKTEPDHKEEQERKEEDKEKEKEKKEIQKDDTSELPPVDYSGYSKHELVETLGLIIDNRPASEIRNDVDRIKSLFYRKLKAEADERKEKFLEDNGKIEDYKSPVDTDEVLVKQLLSKYKAKRTDYNKIQEAEKNENLKKKYDIIDQIKDLVNREESINKTFQEFRQLQNEWHTTGVVPQSSLKDLWENYHHAVEIFYDYIKINKELRDLDLKKNLEAKIVLCEKAEELLLEPNPVNAFRILQECHNQWREIGPVPHESKNELWERFKEATSQINRRHHEYFEKQKEEQRKNLEAKIALCEEVEEINLLELNSFREFDEKAEKVIELQKIWRTIGFAPKKQNNKVYQRFREACDTFFEKKRAFYADNKEIQLNNLQLKNELCVQAEALQESTDWKATSEALIALQKKWKETGPVPRKQSEKCWKRFRKACDYFFNKKAEFFAKLDTSYEDNLKAKLAIIDELESFEAGVDVQVAFERLKDIQRRWTEIGFVPFNMKDEVTNRYRNALNKEFDKLKIGDEVKSILKYKTKLENLKANPKASRKIRNEREKFYAKIKQLESDIVLWENNIGFFAKSSSADTMIKEVEEKIENAKKMIRTLEEKVKMIDQAGLDEQ